MAVTRHGRLRKFIFFLPLPPPTANPKIVPISRRPPEGGPSTPTEKSKLVFEQILADYKLYTGLKLRVPSAIFQTLAGASKERGEHHRVETHLIPPPGSRCRRPVGCPMSMSSARTTPTPDGTCVRDLHPRARYRRFPRFAPPLEEDRPRFRRSLQRRQQSWILYPLEVIDCGRAHHRPQESPRKTRTAAPPATLPFLVAKQGKSLKGARAPRLGSKPHSSLEEIIESAWGVASRNNPQRVMRTARTA